MGESAENIIKLDEEEDKEHFFQPTPLSDRPTHPRRFLSSRPIDWHNENMPKRVYMSFFYNFDSVSVCACLQCSKKSSSHYTVFFQTSLRYLRKTQFSFLLSFQWQTLFRFLGVHSEKKNEQWINKLQSFHEIEYKDLCSSTGSY